MSNLYYHPEKHGWITVGEIQWGEPCYDFDITAVWHNGKGLFAWADDSGCSCPFPFESLIEDEMTTGDFFALEAVLNDPDKYGRDCAETQADLVDLLGRARAISLAAKP